MREWQIFRTTASSIKTLGYVLAANEEEALAIGAERFKISDPWSKAHLGAIEATQLVGTSRPYQHSSHPRPASGIGEARAD
jgi:hypothetical protein